ncbi:MAG: hypothetical protein ABI885_28730 [Gammaproteobacteria bacterium]
MDATVQEQSTKTGAGSSASFLEWLVATHTLTPIVAERVARVQTETSDRLSAILLKLGLLSEPALARGWRGIASSSDSRPG